MLQHFWVVHMKIFQEYIRLEVPCIMLIRSEHPCFCSREIKTGSWHLIRAATWPVPLKTVQAKSNTSNFPQRDTASDVRTREKGRLKKNLHGAMTQRTSPRFADVILARPCLAPASDGKIVIFAGPCAGRPCAWLSYLLEQTQLGVKHKVHIP